MVAARDDLVRRLEKEFDLELLDEAIERVRQRVTATDVGSVSLNRLERGAGRDVAQQLNKKVATVYVARSKVQRMLQEELEKLRAASNMNTSAVQQGTANATRRGSDEIASRTR